MRNIVWPTTDIETLRAAQAVLLPAVSGATREQSTSVLSVSRASVARLRHRIRELSQPETPRRRWGGRGRALLRLEAEAQGASQLALCRIHATLAQHMGAAGLRQWSNVCWPGTAGAK